MNEKSIKKRKHPAAECENCTLYNAAYVPTDGPKDADIVFTGEAPGFHETKEGKPFVGMSGKLLDAIFAEYEIDRSKVMMTNACLCRPEGNRTPTKLEVACCAPRLKAEIDGAKPHTIVTLGNTATAAIVGHSVKITSFRAGPPKQSSIYPNVEVIPTFHPAACLRSADSFPSLVSDIGKIKSPNRERLVWVEPAYRVFDRTDTAIKALTELLSRYDTFVVDIETGAEKDTSFEHANFQRLLCIGIAYERNKAIVLAESVLDNKRVGELLAELLRRKVIAHNGKFDLAGLSRFGRANLFFDTMLASYVVDERGGVHGLKYLATELLGTPDYEDEIRSYVRGRDKDYANIPADLLHKYNAYDVACTWLLYEHYTQQFTDDSWRLHNYLCDVSDVLMDIEMGGIKVDTEYLTQLATDFTTDLEARDTQLTRWVNNPRSPQQVKAALSKLGATVESTDVETLTKVQEVAKGALLDFVTSMLEYRKQHKLFSTYIKGLQQRIDNGRVYPTFLLHGTTTGRLSCRNPNLQNIPRGSAIRKLFVPAQGNVFIQADYSQAELRTVAALAGDRYLQGVFRDGRDIHGEVAERFFGPGWSKEQRVKAKMVVFGLTYAMTPHGLSRRMNIPLAEAQRYQQEFFAVIPQVVDWRESVKKKLLVDGDDLVTPFGRHRRYGLITKDNQEEIIKEGTAFLPQSIASDICLTAVVNLGKALESHSHIRLLVHDSIMVECPVEFADETAELMTRIMEDAGKVFTDWVPYKADVSISKNSWGEL